MKLTILGSGTAAPRLSRNMAGYLLEIANKKILFDSGAGTIRQLLELKVNLLDIDDIFYSFNQGKFLPEGNNSNVQKINKKKFNDSCFRPSAVYRFFTNYIKN